MLVRTPQAEQLRALLVAARVRITSPAPGRLEVSGVSAEQIGDTALAAGIALHELTPQQASLEQAFMELTNDAVEFHGGTTSGRGAA